LDKQQAGVDLYAFSAQHEPDVVPSYESRTYTSAGANDFINVLAPEEPRFELCVEG
jgi:O-glycosyl hydrolase